MYWRLLRQPFRQNCQKKRTLISLPSGNKAIFQIFFAVVFSFVAHFAFAQTEPLEKKITIVAQNEPLENVLSQIAQQTGVRFSYNSQLINPKTKVTINAQNKAVKNILATILPSSVSYKKVGEHIVFVAENRKQKAESDDEVMRRLDDEMIKTGNDKENREKNPLQIFKECTAKPDEVVDTDSLTFLPSDSLTALRSYALTVSEPQFDTLPKKNSSPNNGIPKDDCLDSISFTKNEDMKSQIAGLLMAAATLSAPVLAQDTLAQDTPKTDSVQTMDSQQQVNCKAAQLTFFYPLGTGLTKSAENCYHFSVNILGGVTGQTRGFEAGGLFNINKYGSIGAQFAGLFNITGSKCKETTSYNVQFAGLFNTTIKGISVVQSAGLWNIGDTAYLQVAGLFNIAKSAAVQAGGLFNISNKAIVQAGGLFNVSKESSVQLAGLFNITCNSSAQFAGLFNRGCKIPFQAAGLVNVAEESSCQLAGLVNVTKKGRFQMGLINVRDTADGVSLGWINIVKKGGILEAGIEASEFVHTAVTFRSGVKYLYSIIAVGYNYTEKFWTVGSGLGTSIKLIGNLSLDLELTNSRLLIWQPSYDYLWRAHTQFRPVLNYRFAKHFKMYVGPTLNLLTQDYRPDFNVDAPYSIYHKQKARHRDGYTLYDLWVGVVGGLKF